MLRRYVSQNKNCKNSERVGAQEDSQKVQVDRRHNCRRPFGRLQERLQEKEGGQRGWRRRRRREKRWKGINDTKTAIPTFWPCTALRGRIREYRVRAFDTEEREGKRGLAVLRFCTQTGYAGRKKESAVSRITMDLVVVSDT